MSDDLTARDVIADAIEDGEPMITEDPMPYDLRADAILAALAAAGYTIVTTDDWEGRPVGMCVDTRCDRRSGHVGAHEGGDGRWPVGGGS